MIIVILENGTFPASLCAKAYSFLRVSYQNSWDGRKTGPSKFQKPLSQDPSSFMKSCVVLEQM